MNNAPIQTQATGNDTMPTKLKPLISVCIPAYNAEQHIAATIQSVLNQSYQNFELIIVDDASTDNTQGIINSFSDKRIQQHKNQNNEGPIKTWNRVLSLAKGEYIKILCHDDILYIHNLSTHLQVFLDHPKLSLSVSNRDIINNDGKIISSIKQFKRKEVVEGKALFLNTLKTGRNTMGEPHAILFKKQIIDENSIVFDDNFYLIDLEFYAKVLLYGNAYTINERLSAFRISKKSASVKMSKEQANGYIQFMKKITLQRDYKLSLYQKKMIPLKAKLWQILKNIYYFIYL